MQQVYHLLVSLAFIAHALLGCGIHHICQHGAATGEATSHHCAHHDYNADPTHHSDAPAEEDSDSHRPCQHVTCSFVKADPLRIDIADEFFSHEAATGSSASPMAQANAARQHTPCLAERSSAHLYVWHCALLI